MLKCDNVSSFRTDKEKRKELSIGLQSSIRVISVTSGKGGVGKSNIVVNTAIALKNLGLRVLVLDGDFSLANLNILMDIEVKENLSDVLFGKSNIRSIISKTKTGVDIIPSSSGILEMTKLSINEKRKLIGYLEELDYEYDVLLIDTAAGITHEVGWLNSTANDVIIVTTPEPTAITDAYATMKILYLSYKVKKVNLLINQVENSAEGLKVYNKISEVSDRFLNIGINYLGCIKWDGCITEAVKMRKPLLVSFPGSTSAEGFRKIARSLLGSHKRMVQQNGSQYFWHSLVGTV